MRVWVRIRIRAKVSIRSTVGIWLQLEEALIFNVRISVRFRIWVTVTGN